MARVIGKCLLPIILQRKGVTQQQLADKVGLSRQQISDYANNRRVMSLKNARLIANAINCRIDDLYQWFDN